MHAYQQARERPATRVLHGHTPTLARGNICTRNYLGLIKKKASFEVCGPQKASQPNPVVKCSKQNCHGVCSLHRWYNSLQSDTKIQHLSRTIAPLGNFLKPDTQKNEQECLVSWLGPILVCPCCGPRSSHVECGEKEPKMPSTPPMRRDTGRK